MTSEEYPDEQYGSEAGDRFAIWQASDPNGPKFSDSVPQEAFSPGVLVGPTWREGEPVGDFWLKASKFIMAIAEQEARENPKDQGTQERVTFWQEQVKRFSDPQ